MKKLVLAIGLAMLLSSPVNAEVAKKPLNAIKITSDMVVGKKWTYKHRKADEFGDVILRFTSDKVDAQNKKSSTSGYYEFSGEMICLFLDNWGTACFFVTQDGGRKEIFLPQMNYKTDLTIE